MRKLIYLILLVGLFFSILSCDPESLFRNSPNIQLINVTPNQVNPFDTVYAEVQAINPEEGTLSFQWSVSPEAGFFIDPTDRPASRWIAPTTGGDYSFKITVSNSFKSADRTSIVRVVEPTIPIVKITSPQSNEYFVHGQEIPIEVNARHNNGINTVKLYINSVFIREQSGNPANSYLFTLVPDTSYLGETEIKIEGIANFIAAMGADSIIVNIEGILPKRLLKNYQ